MIKTLYKSKRLDQEIIYDDVSLAHRVISTGTYTRLDEDTSAIIIALYEMTKELKKLNSPKKPNQN